MNTFKKWCKFCANHEASQDCEEDIKEAAMSMFEIDPSDLYICIDCNSYMRDFLNFHHKTKLMSEMFNELYQNEMSLSSEEVEKIYEIYTNPQIEMIDEPEEILFTDNDEEKYDSENDIILNCQEQFIEKYEEEEIIQNMEQEENIIKIEESIEQEIIIESNETSEKSTDDQQENDTSLHFKFECHICSQVFPKMFYLSTHCRSEHKCLPQVKCKICDKLLQTTKALSYHIELHFQGDYKFKCEYCKKVYKTQSHFNNHVRSAHSSNQEERRYTCITCSKSFKEQRHLIIHQNTHLPDEQKFVNVCTICNKKYSSLFSLRQHIKCIHVNQAIFKCKECDKRFSRKANLDSHMNVHSNDKKFKCDVCGLKLKTKANLRIHKKIHSTDPNDLISCGICNKMFKTSNQLTNHLISHSDEKKYVCVECNAGYKRLKELKGHMMSVHLNLRKYKCQWCLKTFVNNSNCRKHKKNSHPLELEEYEKYEKSKLLESDDSYIIEEVIT